jgi:chorismate mutase/prephenate dehydratase
MGGCHSRFFREPNGDYLGRPGGQVNVFFAFAPLPDYHLTPAERHPSSAFPSSASSVSAMTTDPVALARLRRQIDEIDDQIHDLMMRRAQVVVEIGAAKAGGPLVRPAREAEILRRLVKRNRLLPATALVRIWREMIVAMTSLEGPLSVAVYLPDNDPGFWDLARDYYGATVPLARHRTPGAVLRAVTEQPGLIGILPFPREGEAEPWWRHLATDEGESLPRIIARLPFLSGRGRDALVVARVPSEASGDDRSLVVLELAQLQSRTHLLGLTKGAGLAARFITAEPGHGDAPERLHLFDMAGFLGPSDAKLAQLAADSQGQIRRAIPIGSYAVPIEDKAKRRAAPAESAPAGS